jgi:hypothetical protein
MGKAEDFNQCIDRAVSRPASRAVPLAGTMAVLPQMMGCGRPFCHNQHCHYIKKKWQEMDCRAAKHSYGSRCASRAQLPYGVDLVAWDGAPSDFAAFHSFRCRSRTVLMEDPVRGYRYL